MVALYERLAAAGIPPYIIEVAIIYAVFTCVKFFIRRREHAAMGRLLFDIHRYAWQKYLVRLQAVFGVLVLVAIVLVVIYSNNRLLQLASTACIVLLLLLIGAGLYSRVRIYEHGIVWKNNQRHEWSDVTDWQRVADDHVVVHADYVNGEYPIHIYHQPAQAELIDSLLRKKITVQPDL